MKLHWLPLALLFAAPLWAADADGPRVVHVGMVSPKIVEVVVAAGRVELGRQVPYVARDGDKVTQGFEKDRYVHRDGKYIGALVGADRKLLYTPDRLVGAKLDTKWADRADSYRVNGKPPAAVHRKSRPTGIARTAEWAFDAPVEHHLYLALAEPVAEGGELQITFPGGPLPPQAFTFTSAATVSEAVHVTQIGYRPDDPAKVAMLSCWMGSGGGVSYEAGLAFQVLDDAGKVAFSGKTALSCPADRPEDAYKQNLNGVDVYLMDFSGLDRPGRYRVSVAGVGTSRPFEIADDAWERAFYVSARGFYHQRSGIALVQPFTAFARPRCFHPDDGVKVYASTAALMDTGNGLNRKDSNFGRLVTGRTDQIVPDAWGGYHDAGDWDRRIQHLDATRLLLELADLYPDYFAKLTLNIPESGDGLADVVSEALWNLDFFRRLQTKAGGIRGGIESSEHPRHGEASWQESLTVLAYAPGAWSSYLYAGVAARAAGWLESRDAERAKLYRDSALRAMAWAEGEWPKLDQQKYGHAVNDARNLAAAELYRLTGDDRWHKVFLETTAFKKSGVELFVWQKHEQRDAAWVYVRTGRDGVDRQVQGFCRAAIIAEADSRAAWADRTGFRWTKYEYQPAAWGAMSKPDAVSLLRAWTLTGEAKYLRAAVLACQHGAGANPLNMCYTTGVGWRSPVNALHLDSRITRRPPPPGLTVFGPMNLSRRGQEWATRIVAAHVHPALAKWPVTESYFNIFWYPAMCEFTIQNPMAENAYVWGHLAARAASPASQPPSRSDR